MYLDARADRLKGLDDVTDREGCFAELYEHFRRPQSWRCDAEASEVLSRLAERGSPDGLSGNSERRAPLRVSV